MQSSFHKNWVKSLLILSCHSLLQESGEGKISCGENLAQKGKYGIFLCWKPGPHLEMIFRSVVTAYNKHVDVYIRILILTTSNSNLQILRSTMKLKCMLILE